MNYMNRRTTPLTQPELIGIYKTVLTPSNLAKFAF